MKYRSPPVYCPANNPGAANNGPTGRLQQAPVPPVVMTSATSIAPGPQPPGANPPTGIMTVYLNGAIPIDYNSPQYRAVVPFTYIIQ